MDTIILAQLQARPGAEGALRTAVAAVAARGRAQSGVQQFTAHVALDRPGTFMLYEQFGDEAALAGHRARPGARQALLEAEELTDPAATSHSTWQPLDDIHNAPAPAGHTTMVLFHLRLECVRAMRAEIRRNVATAPGMVRFDLNRASDDPGAFLICARWTSRQAWQDHQADPAFAGFRDRTRPMYDGPHKRTLWQPLD